MVPTGGRSKPRAPFGAQATIEDAVRTILVAIGEDPEREGLKGTPERVARMYLEEIAPQASSDAPLIRGVFQQEKYDELVMVRNIPLRAWCEHHLLPFYGRAHVGYIVLKKLLGLSKLARLVYQASRGPTIQERITETVADRVVELCDPLGVMVVIEATHTCMIHRGVRADTSSAVTSAVRGVFVGNPSARAEFLSLLRE